MTASSERSAVSSKKTGENSMFRRIVICLLLPLLLLTVAEAQQPGKIPWIGYLGGAGSGPSPAFIQGLRDLGYAEGKNIAFVFRTAEGKPERYGDLASELVRLKVDVIVTDVTSAVLAAKNATSTIPIVIINNVDPVGIGLVASLARPGGNITELTNISAELGGKFLELLKEIAPKLNRVAILLTQPVYTRRTNDIFIKESEVAARALGVQLIPVVVRGPDDFEGAFRAITTKNGPMV